MYPDISEYEIQRVRQYLAQEDYYKQREAAQSKSSFLAWLRGIADFTTIMRWVQSVPWHHVINVILNFF